MDILLLARPEKALMDMETLEEQKMLVEQMEDVEDISKEVEAIATEATLQLEKLVEEEVGEVGGNFDYIENLLDARPEGALHDEHSEKEGKEPLNLALSDDEDKGVDEEDMVLTHMLVEDVEDISKEMEAIATEATLQLEKLLVEDQEIVPPGMEEPGLANMKMEENVAEEELIEGEKSTRKRKREVEGEEEEEDNNKAKRFCSWRTWMTDVFNSWFNIDFGYFVHLYSGFSDLFVRPT